MNLTVSRFALGCLLLGFPLTVFAETGQCEFQAGDSRLVVDVATNGARLISLYDQGRQRDLLASNCPPLFTVVLRRVGGPEEFRLNADNGWGQTTLRRRRGGFELRWEHPTNTVLGGVSVVASASREAKASAWHWRLRVEDTDPAWTVWRVAFPQIALASLGEHAAVLFPRGPGEVQTRPWEKRFTFGGTYPGGWCSMQFMAAYAQENQPAGLYFGLHDPYGSTKDLGLETDPATRTVRLRFEHPAPNMGTATNGFVLSGEAVWQLLRGDWFDAACIYRDWVRREAAWWPALKAHQRTDTPQWMRDLNVWAMTGGAPADCVTNVLRFRQFLGQPVGFHWYNWHQIPFDNDYPHYFPAKPGFAEAVATLKQGNVFVMPYINGRLWDTHDRGAEDYEFTRLALPAAAKREDGKPFVETYGSKEINGENVTLAVMCPTTALWSETVSNTVLRLLREAGTSSVYVDQVAAAVPVLCQDGAHGHALGGGHWWNQGYWRMLEGIRQARPPETMLTTECNGEPFVRWFDGYLTWHWQFDGQVPAFPAIYGGAIQMFGRAYRGGGTKDLALRMKAGQQLVFGEQLGWLDPSLIKEPGNADFFRQMANVRRQFNRYFSAGQMERPPKLEGALPKVKADWQWSGEWWVTTDAVLAGAWRLPKEKRLVVLFVNVSDQAVDTQFHFIPETYGVRAKKVGLQITRGESRVAETRRVAAPFTEPVSFPACQAQAWEITW